MLLVDIGNTSLKAQWWQSGSLQSSAAINISSGWDNIFRAYLAHVVASECYYACVPGSLAENKFHRCLDDKVMSLNRHKLASPKRGNGVVSAYPEAQRLGVDRWLALLGGASVTNQDAIIVDAGSAITVDLLRKDGQHLGGAILPGFNTSITRFREILSVADFNHAEISENELPGCSTESCIHINYDSGDSNYLDRLIERWFGLLSSNAVLVVSGGDAGRVIKHPDHDYQIIPDLVFRGMRRQLELGNENIF